jgi:hypothetical protein
VNDERWFDLIDSISTKFGLLRDERSDLEYGPGTMQVIEFDTPAGRMKLERVSRPVIKEKKTRYSKRAGAATTEEYVYEEGEFTHRVSLFRWIDGDWEEQDYRGVFRA